MSENIVELNSDNFETEVIASDIPVIVDFASESCMPCKMLKPTLDELAEELLDDVKIVTVDVIKNNDIALKYSVQAVPTLLFMKNGEVIKRLVGLNSKNEIKEIVDEILGE